MIYSNRADQAAHSIYRLFGQKAAGIPGTLLGAVNAPDYRKRKTRFLNWHYWWQAHFLEAIIDTAERHQAHGQEEEARTQLKRAHALLHGIQVRNFGTYINNYYDDMAWLTLAVQRLNRLSQNLTGKGSPAAQDAGQVLYKQLTQSIDGVLGGGAYWSKARDFKNTPANAPIALAFIRAHRYQEAINLLNWLHTRLWDENSRTYLDGISLKNKEPRLEEGRYSYNSGPVLGALLELPQEAASQLTFDRSSHIAQIINGVFTHYTRTFTDSQGQQSTLLASGGDGDGGLFPGILARYLAQAVGSPLVSPADRQRLRTLLTKTADTYWAGRREFDPTLPMSTPGIDPTSILNEAVSLFSPDVTRHVSDVLRPGAPAELSSQLTAWIILEAAEKVASLAEDL